MKRWLAGALVSLFSMSNVLVSAQAPATAETPASINTRKMEAMIQEEMASRKIPGLQLTIVQHGHVVFSGAYGLTNVENSVRVTTQTIFRINSMSKAFAGVAAMQLVEGGRLDLDATLPKYIERIPASWEQITVRQLLTHTSGLPEIVDDNVKLIGDGSNDDAWKQVQTLPLQFAPGTQFVYTQTNYVALGKTIDKLTAEPFTSFIQQHQFDVADMKSTSYGDSLDVTPHVASLYTYLHLLTKGTQTTGVEKYEVLKTRYEVIPQYLRSAAGVQSTSEDLAKWVVALQAGKLFRNKNSLDSLWTPQKLKNGTYGGFSDQINGYALGWPVIRRSNHPVISPVGGERAALFIYPADDLTVIVLTNLLGASPQEFIEKIAALYIPNLQSETSSGKPQ